MAGFSSGGDLHLRGNQRPVFVGVEGCRLFLNRFYCRARFFRGAISRGPGGRRCQTRHRDPPHFDVKVVEKSDDTAHFTQPQAPQGDDLSGDELIGAVGGREGNRDPCLH